MSGINSMMFANNNPAVAAGGDSFSAQTVTLLHFEGANLSSTFTDNGKGNVGSGYTWYNPNGYGTISTIDKKFGSSSFYYSRADSQQGAGLYLYPTVTTGQSAGTVPAEWLPNGDHTIEWWGWHSTETVVCPYGLGPAKYNFLNINGIMTIEYSVTGNYTTGAGGTGYNSIDFNLTSYRSGWHHYAIVRSSNALKVFVDGTALTGTNVQGGSGGQTTFFQGGNMGIGTHTTGAMLEIAGLGGQYHDYGFRKSFMDEFRYTTAARYTANFTAPTAAFTNP